MTEKTSKTRAQVIVWQQQCEDSCQPVRFFWRKSALKARSLARNEKDLVLKAEFLHCCCHTRFPSHNNLLASSKFFSHWRCLPYFILLEILNSLAEGVPILFLVRRFYLLSFALYEQVLRFLADEKLRDFSRTLSLIMSQRREGFIESSFSYSSHVCWMVNFIS